MQRAIAVIAALGGCALAGCNCAARLNRRYRALAEFCAAITHIRLGLTHTNRTVAALLDGCGERETGELFRLLAADVNAGCTPLAAWGNAQRAGHAPLQYLKPCDQKALTVFFSLLGGTDRRSQLEHASASLYTLSSLCADAKRTYEKNGRLYRTMGVLLGVGAAILLM